VQFGRVLPWATGIPVPHRAVARDGSVTA
jgi:hypothetical protein